MYTLEKCRCITCYKQNIQYSPPKWAVLGGVRGGLRFSEEVTGSLEGLTGSVMDIMPFGSGICLSCYENISPNYAGARKVLEDIMTADQGTAMTTIEESFGPKNTSWLWPQTPSGWKVVVMQRAFSNDICSGMQDGLVLGGKSVSWFSATTRKFENGVIDSYNIETRLCKVSRVKGSQTFTRNLSPSSLFPPNAICEKSMERESRSKKPKCCAFCQNLCLSGVEGPGYLWYCCHHPVEKFFVLDSASKFEVLAWMEEDNHRRGEMMSVIDTESSLGIAVYGSQREVVLASCEGCSISTKVNVTAEPTKDTCHECKIESYRGRICPSTGDSNWYCDGCWDKYWDKDKKEQDKYSGDFPSLS